MHQKSINNIITNPIYNIFGESTESKIAQCSRNNKEFCDEFEALIMDVFKDNSAGSSNEREKIFNKIHIMRTDQKVVKKLTCTLKNSVGSTTFSDREINNFIQVFVLDLIGEIFKGLVNLAKTTSEVKSESISDNDTKVIFYISGYIIQALQKKYCKLKNKAIREKKMELLQQFMCNTTEKTFTEKFKAMAAYKNRGGLKTPCDDFFLMVREFENVIRQNVNHENLHAKSIMKHQCKENILDSFMVKHYSTKLFGGEEDTDNEREQYLEDCMHLFLTVRGFALAKLVNKKLLEMLKI